MGPTQFSISSRLHDSVNGVGCLLDMAENALEQAIRHAKQGLCS